MAMVSGMGWGLRQVTALLCPEDRHAATVTDGLIPPTRDWPGDISEDRGRQGVNLYRFASPDFRRRKVW